MSYYSSNWHFKNSPAGFPIEFLLESRRGTSSEQEGKDEKYEDGQGKKQEQED